MKGEPQSCVTLFAIVGLLEVLQQTPIFTISAPPLEIIVPPLTEDKAVISDTAVVVTVGKTAGQGPQVGTPLQRLKVRASFPGKLSPGGTVTHAVPFQ